MILLLAVAAGLFISLVKAWVGRYHFSYPKFRDLSLVIAAVFPQLLAFYIPPLRSRFSESWVVAIVVVSQLLLLTFIVRNASLPGFPLLGLGLAFNFLVILLNGGMMPISPEVVSKLAPGAFLSGIPVGSRYGFSKDIILPRADTSLWILSDVLLLPVWFPHRSAISIGDVFISVGIVWFLATLTKHPDPSPA